MDADPVRDTAVALLAILGDDRVPPLERVHAVVRRLDRVVLDDAASSMVEQAVARAVVAVGPPLVERTGTRNVAATLAAAEAYVRSPDETTWREFVERATDSYPYGPGDGCLSIDDTCGELGSGCASGAGTLAAVAEELGAELVVERLTAELVPWLTGLAS